MDITDDTHICFRCKQTINGLDNYVEHRKNANCVVITANKFFNCLQLQSKFKDIYHNNDEEDEEDDEDYDDHNIRNVQSGQNQSSEDDDPSDDDIYRPPKDFTGGKWKPGSGPEVIISTTYVTDESSDNSVNFELKKRRTSDESTKSYIENSFSFADKNIYSSVVRQPTDCQDFQTSTFVDQQCLNQQIGNNFIDNELMCKLCNNYKALNSIELLKHYLISTNHSTNDILNLQLITDNELILMKKLSFICEICCFYTNQINNYLWHLTTIDHSVKASSHRTRFECCVCHESCGDVKKLMAHLESNQTHHCISSGPIIICKLSKLKLKAKKSFNRKSNNLFDTFKCDFCGKLFKFKTNLKRHTMDEHIRRVAFPDLIRSNFIGDNPKFSCIKCDFKTDKESIHLLHSVNHQMPSIDEHNNSNTSRLRRSEDKYKCPLCQKLYICRQLKEHINSHINETPYECLKCEKKFSNLVYLRNHEKTHTYIKDKICEICGVGFTLNKLLKRHLKTHDNSRERTFGCEKCGLQFFSRSEMISHMKRHLPKSDRQFKCQYLDCHHSFVNKYELNEHSKVHLSPDDKPFLCDQCPYKTKSIYSLRKHYRQHTDDKPFECNICHFKAHMSANLIRHMRIHTGVKPYRCPYCSYECNTQENIRKHILKTKKHFGLYVYPCNDCNFKSNLFIDYRKHIEDNHSDIYSDQQIANLVSHLFNKK
ncbi:zinc finger protein 816-like [Oppia nitens]|uniref:zinc finger protein 816-like n=1 Tax=Oppia nitens TaxID=1686743 RepID=UPI0023D97C53|nr:zinc finger protein 816-like [Oppia nitens]